MPTPNIGKCDHCDNPAIGICTDIIRGTDPITGITLSRPADNIKKYCRDHECDSEIIIDNDAAEVVAREFLNDGGIFHDDRRN